jgi:hypothetical protein
MDEMNFPCKNCGHAFKWHQQSTFELWYCDYDDNCICNYFARKVASGDDGDEIEVQYDSESYRWN